MRRRQTAIYDRAHYPTGIIRHLMATVSSGTRADRLRQVTVPTVVIHGTVDPLIQPSGGEHTAEMIPGAELIMLEGMGHDLPPFFWLQIIDAIEKVAARA